MMSKHRIAVLISLMLAMPAAVVALEQATTSPAEAQTEPAAQPVAVSSEPIIGTAPIGGAIRAMPSSAFPKGGADTEWERVPAAVAYLDRLELQRGNLIARGDVFPVGTRGDNDYQPLPAQVAYFEQRDGARVTSAQAAAPAETSRNPLQSAADYVTGLFKSHHSSAPAESTAAVH